MQNEPTARIRKLALLASALAPFAAPVLAATINLF